MVETAAAAQSEFRHDRSLVVPSSRAPLRLRGLACPRLSDALSSMLTSTSAAVWLASLATGYVFGSVPFGYLAGRIHRIDIRKHGSGNIGFTNVYRVLGAANAVPVLLLDVGKGLLPTALAPAFGFSPGLTGLGAILGHMFTPWLGFRGGKGVATTIGVSALLCFKSLVGGLGVYALVLGVTGFVSLSSLAFGIALPGLTALLYRGNGSLLAFAAGVGFLIVARHRSNVIRLLKGTEPRFGLWLRLFTKSK